MSDRFSRPLYVLGPGAAVSKRGGRLTVMSDGSERISAALLSLSAVVLCGRVEISTPAMSELAYRGVPLVLLRADGRAIARLEPAASAGADLRIEQLRRAGDDRARLELARVLVSAKIHNQRVLLLRRSRRSPDTATTEVIDQLRRYERQVAGTETLAACVGVEGIASRQYFAALRGLLPQAVRFGSRGRHGPDLFNALVNWCSALLREQVLGALSVIGLDPTASFLHTPSRGRPTLAFDLMEEWRPLLVEGVALALIGLGVVSTADVEATDEGPRLSAHARSSAIERFHHRLGWQEGHLSLSPTGLGRRLPEQAASLRRWVKRTGDYEPYLWR